MPGPLPGPFPSPRVSAHLKLLTVKRRGSRLLVTGTIARDASPISLIYEVRVGRRVVIARTRVRARKNGHFITTLKLPTVAAKARAGTLVAHYPGSSRYPRAEHQAVRAGALIGLTT